MHNVACKSRLNHLTVILILKVEWLWNTRWDRYKSETWYNYCKIQWKCHWDWEWFWNGIRFPLDTVKSTQHFISLQFNSTASQGVRDYYLRMHLKSEKKMFMPLFGSFENYHRFFMVEQRHLHNHVPSVPKMSGLQWPHTKKFHISLRSQTVFKVQPPTPHLLTPARLTQIL